VAVVALERFVFVVLPSVGLGGGGRRKQEQGRKQVLIQEKAFPPFQPGPKLPRHPSAEGGTPGS